jgi:CheY-like chemotaxis protein
MPEMDGETLIGKIREELKLNTPIIVISANDSQLHVSKYKNIKVLRKPFTPDQIKGLFEK